METLFNIGQDGSLVISERDWDPGQLPAEIRIPAGELPALRAILNAPALAHCQSGNETEVDYDVSPLAVWENLTIEADGLGVNVKRYPGMGNTPNADIWIPKDQLPAVVEQISRLARMVPTLEIPEDD